MRGKDLGDGGRGIGVRTRRKTGGRRGWDARYTKKCITKVTDCQVICCISFERSGKLKKKRLLMAWKGGGRWNCRRPRGPGFLTEKNWTKSFEITEAGRLKSLKLLLRYF